MFNKQDKKLIIIIIKNCLHSNYEYFSISIDYKIFTKLFLLNFNIIIEKLDEFKKFSFYDEYIIKCN